MITTTAIIARLNALTTCTHDDANDPYRPDCDADAAARDLRSLLIDSTDSDLESDSADELRELILALLTNTERPYDESARHALSELRLDYSLCPMHAIDYAICFDDDDADCATIRAFFPCHDT